MSSAPASDSSVTKSVNELALFKQYYSKLRTLNLHKLTAYFVGKEIIDFEDEENITNAITVPQKSSIILIKVSYHLESGVTTSLYAMLDIICQRGDIAGKEIAQQMRQELLYPQESSKEFTAKQEGVSVADLKCDAAGGLDFSKYDDVSLALTALMSKFEVEVMSDACFQAAKTQCVSRAQPSKLKRAIERAYDMHSLFKWFACNSVYCNWMNIRFLETIATAVSVYSGNNRLEKLIQDYKDSIYSRTLRQVWEYLPAHGKLKSKHYSKLRTVFLNKDPATVTVAEVLTHCKPRLAESIALDIMEIGKGSLKISWLILTDDVYPAFVSLLTVPQELRHDDLLQVGAWVVHHPQSVLLEHRKSNDTAMMSTPTVLVGYYHGLLLRDINVDQLCNKLCSSGLLTTHDQHLISTGYSVYQKKYLLLETVRHMDEKSLLVACGVLYELWPEIGAQLNAVLQFDTSLISAISDGDVTKYLPEHINTTSVHIVFFHLVDHIRELLQQCDQQQLLKQCREMKASDINNTHLFAVDQFDTESLLLFILYCHTTWSDHSIIRQLSSSVSEAIKLFDEFDSKLDYSQPISSYPIPYLSSDMFPTDLSSTHTVLSIRCDQELCNCTLQYVCDMKSLMVEKCDITLHCLQLLAVRPNPTTIYWSIPKCVVELISSKVPVHSDYLYCRGVLEVLVYPEPLLATSDDVRIGYLAFVADGDNSEEELTTLLENYAEEKIELCRKTLEEKMELIQKISNEKSKETEECKLKLTQMQSELSELDMMNRKVQQKEKENKKLLDKASKLRVANEEVQKQNKQLEDRNKQLQENLNKVQAVYSTDMSDKAEVMVKKLQAAWEGVRSNLQNIPLISSHMETVGSDLSKDSKHVDIISEDSQYLSKLDNIYNDIQGMKEWTTLFVQSEKKKLYQQETIPPSDMEEYKVTEMKSDKEKTAKLNVHKLDEAQPGDIKQLEKVHNLGTGRYGQTSEAIFNNRKCAIKVFHKALLDPSQSVSDILAGIHKRCSQCLDLHHPNLVKLIDITEIDNRPGLIIELMEVNLSTYITRKGGSLSLYLQVLISLDMSQGLEALHKHSLIHGHLHDHNILIQGDQAKISDYYYPLLGLEDHHIDMKRVLPYMAPEVNEDKSLLSISSDVYSLGALILQVVTGTIPTEGSTKNLADHVSQAHILSWLIQQCLSKDTGRRPSATKMCEDVRRLQECTQYISSRAMMQTGSLPLFQTIKDGRHHFKWKDCSPLPAPLFGATAVILGNIIYVSGGDSPDASASHHVFAYHLLEDHWERLPALSHAHGVPVVVDGKVTVIGGKDTKRKKITNRVSTYDENTQKWESLYPNLREVRYGPLAIVYKHYIIVGGGKYHVLFDILYDDIEILDTQDEKLTWRKVPTRLPAKMWAPSATISNDRLWIVGYNNDNSGSFNIIEQRTDETYWIQADDIVSNQKNEWTSLPRLSPYYSSTVVPYYYPIITVGGDTKDTRTVDALLMFDSSSDSWNQVASLSGPPRAYTAVASLGEQQAIVVLGGCTETKNKKARNESSVVLVQIGYAAELPAV